MGSEQILLLEKASLVWNIYLYPNSEVGLSNTTTKILDLTKADILCKEIDFSCNSIKFNPRNTFCESVHWCHTLLRAQTLWRDFGTIILDHLESWTVHKESTFPHFCLITSLFPPCPLRFRRNHQIVGCRPRWVYSSKCLSWRIEKFLFCQI